MRGAVTRCGLLAAVVSIAMLVLAVAPAGAGGNSANAKLCQKGGWQTLYSTTGGFASEKACVSYAASGGILSTFSPDSPQGACAAVGGSYGLTAGPGIPYVLLWSCGGGPFSDAALERLVSACDATDPGNTQAVYGISQPTLNLTCYSRTMLGYIP